MRGMVRYAVHGFAFGIGFALAAALAWLAFRELGGLAGEVRGVASAGAPVAPVGPTSGAPAASVRVASHRLEHRNGDAIVLGMLRNDADAPVRSVRVEAAFYDAKGALVDLCGWYIAPVLAPGEEKAFKVSCGGLPERPVPESASVRLRLVEAW